MVILTVLHSVQQAGLSLGHNASRISDARHVTFSVSLSDAPVYQCELTDWKDTYSSAMAKLLDARASLQPLIHNNL
jgi:hypothetical protein